MRIRMPAADKRNVCGRQCFIQGAAAQLSSRDCAPQLQNEKENEITELEQGMWKSAKYGERKAFAELVCADAVMVCGGYRCTGAEYSELISDFGIAGFEITNLEIVHEAAEAVQIHYIVKTTASAPENADLAGTFHVTSTWEKRGGAWQLVFNMDSRIAE